MLQSPENNAACTFHTNWLGITKQNKNDFFNYYFDKRVILIIWITLIHSIFPLLNVQNESEMFILYLWLFGITKFLYNPK